MQIILSLQICALTLNSAKMDCTLSMNSSASNSGFQSLQCLHALALALISILTVKDFLPNPTVGLTCARINIKSIQTQTSKLNRNPRYAYKCPTDMCLPVSGCLMLNASPSISTPFFLTVDGGRNLQGIDRILSFITPSSKGPAKCSANTSTRQKLRYTCMIFTKKLSELNFYSK